jgi:hypothetical protein
VNRDIFAGHILGTARELGARRSDTSGATSPASIAISSNGSLAEPAFVNPAT